MTDDEIIQAAASGMSTCEVAASFGLEEREVLEILDRAGERWFTGSHLRRELALEVERLNLLERRYFAVAMGSAEGAVTAGGLYCKLAERKATLLGLNAAQASASITIHQTVGAAKISSTERIREALDRLRELPAPNGEADSGES